MSKPVSALQVSSYSGYAQITEGGLHGMITLRGDIESPKMRKAMHDVMGLTLPKERAINVDGDKAVAWMSPDELLLMVPHSSVSDTLNALNKSLAGQHFLAADVSDARAVLRVQGDAAREIIAKLCPVDMAPGVFGPGQIRRTRMAQIAAALWMPAESEIVVVCFRSVAQYAFDLLKDAAAPGGEASLFT